MNKETINIGGHDYFMASSAYTQFAYKNLTGRSFLNDIQKLMNLDVEHIDENMNEFEHLMELLLNICFVMINEADSKQVDNYESFLKGIPSLFDDATWIEKTINLAVRPLSGRIQTSASATLSV